MEPLLSNRVYNLSEPQWSGEAPFVTVDTFSQQHEDLHPIYDLGESWRYDRQFVDLMADQQDATLCTEFDDVRFFAGEDYPISGHFWGTDVIDANWEDDSRTWLEAKGDEYQVRPWKNGRRENWCRLGAANRGRMGMNKSLLWNITNSAKEDIARCTDLNALERKWESAVDELWITYHGLDLDIDLSPMISLLTDTLNTRVKRLEARNAVNAARRAQFDRWQKEQEAKLVEQAAKAKKDEEQRLLEMVIVKKGTHMIRVSRKVYGETYEKQGYIIKQ